MVTEAHRPLEVGPEVHWANGLYFARITELGHELSGGVRIRHRGGGQVAEFLVPASEWASIVAAVTPEGDTATTYRIAQGLHG